MVDITNVQKIIERHILSNQTNLILHLFKEEIFYFDDILNNDNNNDDEQLEIYQWYLIDDFLYMHLNKHKEPLLKNKLGIWWGRTTFGQSIFIDDVILKIYNEIKK